MKRYYLGCLVAGISFAGIAALGCWLWNGVQGGEPGAWLQHFYISGPILGVTGALLWSQLLHHLTA